MILTCIQNIPILLCMFRSYMKLTNLCKHFCKDNSRKSSIDFSKPLFGKSITSLQKLVANASKTTERATLPYNIGM
jgi:hypothetical protein